MEQLEFNQRMSLIKDLIKEANTLKNEIDLEIKSTPNKTLNFVKNTDNRNSLFLQYLDILKEFSFSDKLTAPSEIFAGIRTASDMANPEELSKKANLMKEVASSINTLQKKISMETSSVISSLNKVLKTLSEYILQENKIYDLSLELLQDADSIYDIGDFARNT